jgi:hypothetical protein
VAVVVNARPTAAITGTQTICAGDSSIFTATGGSTYAWSTGGAAAAITVHNAGTYRVIVTNAAGCVDSMTRTLTVNARPTAGMAVVGATNICQGDSTILRARGGVTYRWSLPAGATSTDSTVIAKVTGVYKVVVANASGCTDSLTASITVNPKPTVLFTSSSAAGRATFTNTSTGGNTYSWNFGDTTALDTARNPLHTYRYNGTYQVRLVVTSAAGCRDSVTLPIVITRVANEEILKQLNAVVYPNPASDFVRIEFRDNVINFGVNDFIIITDAFGREVHRQALNGNLIEIDSEKWSAGVYLINAVIENKRFTLSKIVKVAK